jgi:hypothetical protein
MTASEFDECIKGFPISADPQYGWRFRTIAQIAGDPKSTAETASLKRSLKIGSEVALKPWLTSTALKTFGVVALGSVLAPGNISMSKSLGRFGISPFWQDSSCGSRPRRDSHPVPQALG